MGVCFDGVYVEIDYNNCWSNKTVFESGTVWECITFKMSTYADNGLLEEMEKWQMERAISRDEKIIRYIVDYQTIVYLVET